MKAAATYRHTLAACCGGYVVQAAVNNVAPLLFVTFTDRFGLSLGALTTLISLNFGVQLLVDLAAAWYVDRLGYRAAAVAAHVCAALGFVLMGTLPAVLPSPYAALVIATVINAVGGGLLEVIVSPIVEALPTAASRKSAAMSLLHSFYCWGCVAVILLSTWYFSLVPGFWNGLPLLWAALPLGNAVFFARVPLWRLGGEAGKETSGDTAVPGNAGRGFFLFMTLMLCAGAAEQAMSQWASFFAEAGIGLSKTLGNILGPCGFAALMGGGRLLFALLPGAGGGADLEGGKNPRRALLAGAALCAAGYLVTAFAPWPLVSLAGCAVCGLAVSVMWPGTLSLASRAFPQGGTALFAFLALAGDLGCGAGPSLVGLAATTFGALRYGFLAALLFPAGLALGVWRARGVTPGTSRPGPSTR